jgi:hypothetical protein
MLETRSAGLRGARLPLAARRSTGAGAAQVKSDWVGLIDEWAGRFFQELDYEREAASAATFAAQMADLPGITTPDVRPDLSSHTVLTTAWVPGARGPARARAGGPLLGCRPFVRAAQAGTPTAGLCKETWHSWARRTALFVSGLCCACRMLRSRPRCRQGRTRQPGRHSTLVWWACGGRNLRSACVAVHRRRR